MGKKGVSNSFNQFLTKVLPAACIQLHNYDLFEKARLKVSLLYKTVSIRIISQNHTPGISLLKKKYKKNIAPTGVWTSLPPTLPLHLNLYGKPLGWKKILTKSQKFTHFPHIGKISIVDLNLSLSKVHFFPIK